MVTSFELRARASNLLNEQKQRLDKLAREKAKEEAIQRRLRERQEQLEEEQRLRRLAELEAQEKAAKAREELTEHNRGVYFQADLLGLEADEAATVARGIRRAKDKVVLPPSVGASLMAQDAARNGAMLFRLRSRSTGAVTHAGLLEFTAPEGCVLLPRKVRECLYGNGGVIPPSVPAPPQQQHRSPSPGAAAPPQPQPDATSPPGVLTPLAPLAPLAPLVGRGASPQPPQQQQVVVPDLEVTYVRLDKGTFVRFQPLTRGFHEQVVGEDVRTVLETTLMQCSTLTQGDTLRVEHLGEEHVLRVMELQPEAAVSTVDTDMEAEVVSSLETEELIQAWEDEQRRTAQRLADLRAAREAEEEARRQEQERLAREQREAEERAAAQAQAAEAQRAAERAARLAALGPEPDAQQGGGDAVLVVQCAFRLPSGARVSRRFLSSAPLGQLFAFVDMQDGLQDGLRYNLITQFPRRTLQRPAAAGGQGGMEVDGAQAAQGPTLQSLGLGQGGPELFLLEPLAEDDE